MGRYRINYANSSFPWKVGTVFEAYEGPTVNAAARLGDISRVDPPDPRDARPNTSSEVVSDVQKHPESSAETTEESPEGEDKQKKTKKGS